MPHGSRVCPECGRLNSVDDKTCFHCGKRMPGPLAASALGFVGDFSAGGLPATKLLAGMCIVVYGLMMATDASGGGIPGLTGFHSWTLLRFGALYGRITQAEPWRVLSAVFVHGSLIHIGMNMLSLINLGRTLEPHFRSARFLVLYLLSGALGFCGTLWWRGGNAFSVGASGAVFGLLGAFIGALIIRRNPGWQRVFLSNLIMAGVLAYVVQGVDNAAHVAGFLSGLLLGLLLELERQPRRRDRLLAGLAAVGVMAALASIALSARSPVWKVLKQLEAQAAEEEERQRLNSE
jgi:rhomboid protease GluP